jgi:peptidoglycan/LPS O-acetylase OafA/YrhL
VVSSVVIVLFWLSGIIIQPESAIGQVCTSQINLMFVLGMTLSALLQAGYQLPRWGAIIAFTIALASMLWSTQMPAALAFVHRYHLDAALIVAACLSLPRVRIVWLNNLLLKLGDSSYSLYLVHPILAPAICVGLVAVGFRSPYWVMGAAFVACVIAGHFIYRFVENPLNDRARNYLGPLILRKPPAAATVTNARV